MMTYNRAQILAQIIIRIKLGAASAEEREVLGGWLDECEENRQLYKNIIRWKCIGERLRLEDEINQTTDFKRVHRIVSRRLAYKNSGQKRWIRVAWTSGVAAVCLYGVFFIWNLTRQPEISLVTSEPRKAQETKLSPKRGKVMLVLEDGRQIGLERNASDSIKLAQITIVEAGKSLQYKPIVDSIPPQEVIHKIYTTVGGDYSLVLSDGTRVWLNAETELEYPVQFAGKERMVKLTGEAYFEVMPDAERPFIVETGNMRTRVLGTSFNINAYTNEGAIYTTLLSGRVEVSLADATGLDVAPVVLKPGMQSSWKQGASGIELREVDLDNVIAWRYGVFVFNEDNLDVVTRVLSRWYGVQFVEDEGGVGRHTFSGKMSKDEKLESILKILTLAGGPEFKREGDTIRVIERK
jgi:fecR protein